MSLAVARLRGAGAVSLALVPLAMAAANKSSPAVVGLAALFFLLADLIEDRAIAARRLVDPLRSPLGLAALAFLGWCGLSLFWSPFPALSWRTIREFLPALIAAYLLARLAPGRLPPSAAKLAAGVLAFTGIYVVASLAAGLPIQRALGQRVAEFVFNRPVMTMALVALPLTTLLLSAGQRIAALIAASISLAAILGSVSGAAKLGLAAGLTMLILAWIVPRRVALGLAALGLGLAVALAPIEGELLHRLMPDTLHERLIQSSSRARVAIARSFGAAVAGDPWRGAGYGTAARFAEAPVAAALEPEVRTLLAVGHPHNSFLQIWAELGIVGAALAAAVLLLTLNSLAGLPQAGFAAALGLIAGASAIAFVEHGAWQPWWVASLGAAIAWTREGFAQAAAATTRFRPESLAR